MEFLKLSFDLMDGQMKGHTLSLILAAIAHTESAPIDWRTHGDVCPSANAGAGGQGGFLRTSWAYHNAAAAFCKEQHNIQLNCTFGTGLPLPCPIPSTRTVAAGDEATLLAYLAAGPIAAGVDASARAFEMYTGGVLRAKDCGTGSQSDDHSVLIVGAGVDQSTPYWIVQNDWGSTWGEQGYIRIERNANACGIATDTLQPVVLRPQG